MELVTRSMMTRCAILWNLLEKAAVKIEPKFSCAEEISKFPTQWRVRQGCHKVKLRAEETVVVMIVEQS